MQGPVETGGGYGNPGAAVTNAGVFSTDGASAQCKALWRLAAAMATRAPQSQMQEFSAPTARRLNARPCGDWRRLWQPGRRSHKCRSFQHRRRVGSMQGPVETGGGYGNPGAAVTNA